MNSKELSGATLDQTSNFDKLHIKVICWAIKGLLYMEMIAVWLYTQKKRPDKSDDHSHYLFKPNYNVKMEASFLHCLIEGENFRHLIVSGRQES